MAKPAVFWDRDNTLIADPGYLSDPAAVKLMPGAADALRRVADAGYENIVVTNQSGVARGLFDEATLGKIHETLIELLAHKRAPLHAIYYCPYLPGDEAVVAAYRQDSDLRKPKPGMLLKASLERKIDLPASWCVGDSLRDTQAGRSAGCRTILLVRDDTPADAARDSSVDFTAASAQEAAEIVLRHTRQAGPAGESEPPETSAVLQEILNYLRMRDRRSALDDFSLSRLVGVIVSMLALAIVLWTIISWLTGDGAWGSLMTRLMLAVFLQLLSLTLILSAPRK